MVSGSVSLPYSGYFSPFPHGTGSLSVSREYLALPDGPGGFTQGFPCPALLRIPLSTHLLPVRGYHPVSPRFPAGSGSFCASCRGPTTPTRPVSHVVWALPRSLATTGGITIVFSSSGYLDVSVHQVCPRLISRYYIFNIVGCPIRKSADRNVCAIPRSLSQLITSFIASESLGIPHTPFLACHGRPCRRQRYHRVLPLFFLTPIITTEATLSFYYFAHPYEYGRTLLV